MLSYIYQLAYRFEHQHNLRPNTLYLTSRHFEQLRHEFADPEDISGITDYLGMHVVLTGEVSHPRLAHLQRSWHATNGYRTSAAGSHGRSVRY